jgi:hypothetical protein
MALRKKIVLYFGFPVRHIIQFALDEDNRYLFSVSFALIQVDGRVAISVRDDLLARVNFVKEVWMLTKL